jgi:uncharacterized protein YegL
MLLLNENLEQFKVMGSNFKFSGERIQNLGATEYTLVSIVCDISGSVSFYAQDLEKCLGEIILACRKSPRADNIMVRLLLFNTQVEEKHGYKLLQNCNPSDYDHILSCGGGTALFDATYDAFAAVKEYGKNLYNQDFTVNGIAFILTDGDDNSSSINPIKIKEITDEMKKEECLDSFTSVLVGVGVDASISQYLKNFMSQAGLTGYIEMKDASKGSLAKLAGFVSKSISSTSSSLGSGQGLQSNQIIF